MRISGGRARGIPLLVPAGNLVRPATDSMRQSVFSSLGPRIVDAVFLDLFAGSGAYGLEALSRGARRGWFVEKNPKAISCLTKNIAAVGRSADMAAGVASVLSVDVVSPAIWKVAKDINLVFVDPPYELVAEIAPRLLENLATELSSAADLLVVFEHPGELVLRHAKWLVRKELGRRAVRQPAVTIFGLA